MADKSKSRKTVAYRGGWFRLYHDLVDDPKVQQLPDELFKFWVNLLCLTSRERTGQLPDLSSLPFRLRLPRATVEDYVMILIDRGLLEWVDSKAGVLAPHNWGQRQPSTSTDRVRKHRQVKRDETQVKRDETLDETNLERENPSLVSSVLSTTSVPTIGCKAYQESERPLEDTYTREADTGGGWDDADVFLDDEIGGAA